MTVTATILDHMGSDRAIADAARVSFATTADDYPDHRVAKLIARLARDGHFTPFTHALVSMIEEAPIFVARQRLRHTVGFTYNETSRRYVDYTPTLWSPGPDGWRARPDASIKQGSGGAHERSVAIERAYQCAARAAIEAYDAMIADGVAPEMARAVLPQGMTTRYVVTGSLAAWARAYGLRSAPDAQAEIRDLAACWDRAIRPLFPVAWAALVDEGTA